MGQFAEGTVNIYLNSEEDAKKVHAIFSNPNVEEEFEKFLGEKAKGYYEFIEFDEEQEGKEVYFRLCSGRVQNAEWQMEQVVALLKKLVQAKEISGVGEFSGNIMIEGEGYYYESSEFEEGGEDE
jgi:hypothetical protein